MSYTILCNVVFHYIPICVRLALSVMKHNAYTGRNGTIIRNTCSAYPAYIGTYDYIRLRREIPLYFGSFGGSLTCGGGRLGTGTLQAGGIWNTKVTRVGRDSRDLDSSGDKNRDL